MVAQSAAQTAVDNTTRLKVISGPLDEDIRFGLRQYHMSPYFFHSHTSAQRDFLRQFNEPL
jgi:hypothetical protein